MEELGGGYTSSFIDEGVNVESDRVEPGGCLSSFIDTGSVESHRLFLARRTLMEMLSDRGYAVSPSESALTLVEFRANYGDSPELDSLRISTTLLANPTNKVLVIFCGPEMFKVSSVRNIYGQVQKENLSRLILVLQNKMTSQARTALEDFKFKLELFEIEDLLVNITKHILKPKHDVLTAEEKKELLKKYNVQDKQLPRMLEKDAISRYYGLEKGQVVKVSYDGELTGNHTTYRCIM